MTEDEILGIFFLGGSSNFWFVATLICGWRKYFGTENLPKCCLTGNCSLISTYETLTIIVFNLATRDKVWFRISWLVLWKKKIRKGKKNCCVVWWICAISFMFAGRSFCGCLSLFFPWGVVLDREKVEGTCINWREMVWLQVHAFAASWITAYPCYLFYCDF